MKLLDWQKEEIVWQLQKFSEGKLSSFMDFVLERRICNAFIESM